MNFGEKNNGQDDMIAKAITPLEIPLSKDWCFALDPEDGGEKAGWQSSYYRDSGWERVSLPHTWNTVEKYAAYEGIAWYRLTFPCPSQVDEAQVRLIFDAVFYLARVWLNGEYLGEHEGGYTPFEFAISPKVRPGAENILAVRVDNRRATDRLPAHLFEGRSYGWNNYGGIVRDVKLVLTSRVYIESVRLIATPRITSYDQADLASLSTQVSISNISDEAFNGQVIQEIREESSGRIVATTSQPVEVSSGRNATFSFETSFEDPMLWHFDHPHLYRCITSLKDINKVEYHHKITTFGIREVDWKDGEFRLNGEPVRLAGLSRHADVPGYGLAEPIAVMAADFDDLKTLNMVFGRPVHYPQHEYIYNYCDRKGILLCPELPAWQLTAGQMADDHMRALARQQLSEMIAAAANHPCIWAWSIGNELESDTVAGRAYVQDMSAFVKSLDPTRPVSFASYHLLVGRPWGDATIHADFVMMNQYFGTWHGPKDSLSTALDTIHLTWPDKAVVVSEFGFAPHWQRIEGPRMIDPTQYYHIPEDASVDSAEADIQRQRVIRDQMAVFRCSPFVSAAIFWAYRGGMGVVDDHSQPRPSWQTLREEFSPVMIEGADFSFQKEEQGKVSVSLRTRGPVDADLPAYTLRNYRVAWELLSPTGKSLDLRGEANLPVLPPGTIYNLNIEMPQPLKGGQLHIFVMRPTGFSVIDRRFIFP